MRKSLIPYMSMIAMMSMAYTERGNVVGKGERDIKEADTQINQKQVWKLEGEDKKEALRELVLRIRQIGTDLLPFMPKTAEKILNQYNTGLIKKGEPLFMRLQNEG